MTPAELRTAERELADIPERGALGFLIAFARRYPDDTDIAQHFFRRVGVPEKDMHSKLKALYTIARAPRLAA